MLKRLLLASGLALAIAAGFCFVRVHPGLTPRPEPVGSPVNPAPGVAPAADRAKPAAASAASAPIAEATDSHATAVLQAGQSRRAWDYNFFARLAHAPQDGPIQFELTGGVMAAGTIRHLEHANGELILISGDIAEPEAGRFSFRKQTLPGKAGDYSGEVIFPQSKRAFRLEPSGPGGTSELVERRLDEVLCLALPALDPARTNELPEELPPLNPQTVPDVVPAYNDGIISLQSLPGAIGVLYMDFRGGYTPTWGGITYERPDVSNAQIKDVWKRVAEDFMPFKINVTTDIKVFQAAPDNSRQRCVLTPTTTAAPGAGGVAYVGDWNNTGDRPCWSFYSSGKSAAEVVSHEVGHTLGLSHDGQEIGGTNHVEYYAGVNGWAPIMGVGYYQPVAQWSKGEYQWANQHQDDLSIVANNNNGVAYRADDTGATLATSRYLEVYPDLTGSAEGVIEQTSDTDAFQFTTTGGTLSLAANPVGDWANLAMMVTLADANDTVIASNNPSSTLAAGITNNLPAGTYTFRVAGAGRNDSFTNGYSAYASLGYYSITGSVTGARLPTRLSVNEHATNGSVAGTVTALNNAGASPLAYAIVSGNSNTTFAIDASGVVRVANNTLLDYYRLATNTMLAVKFDLLVNITNLLNPALTELNRRVVISVLNVNDPPLVTGFTNVILAGTQPGSAVGTVTFSNRDPWEVLSVSLVGGNSNNAFAIDQGGGVTVAGNLSTAVQTNYLLAVAVRDNALPVSLVGTGYVSIGVLTNPTPFQPGSISYALYDSLGSGTAVSDLTNNARFPRDPSAEKPMPAFEGDSNRADSYGSVMRGYLIPPQSGNYTFWIATDDNGELWMSTTTNPAAMTRIAYISGSANWAGPRDWNKFSTQKSTARSLVAGQAYYIEARHKEGGGGDNLAVAWQGPATANLTNVISGQYLAPYSLNYVPHATGFTTALHQDAIANAMVGVVTMTDVNASDGHTFAITSGNGTGLFSLDPDSGVVRVADAAGLAASALATYNLQVTVTDTGTPPLAANTTATITVVASNIVATTSVRREIFRNLGSGTAVSDLTNSAPYPGRPDAFEVLASLDCAQNIGDSYGSRVRARLTPTTSGAYKFFIASDDSSSLLLSPDSNPSNAVRIAYVSGWTDYTNWTTYASQMSTSITLVAGQSYYLEALQKEGGGSDNLSVAWAGPGLTGTNAISGSFLSAVDINYPPQFTNQTLRVFNNVANGTFIGRVTALDSAMDTLTFSIVAGNTNNMFAIAADTGGLTVLDNTLITNGAMTTFPLTIVAQDTGYGGWYPLKSAQATVTVSVISPGTAFTWTGAADSNNWASPNNWGGVVPGPNARLTFGVPAQQASGNDAISSAASVTFSTGGFSLSGAALTLQAGLTNTGNNSVALDTTLGAAQTWLNSSGTLSLDGALANAGFLLTLAANADVQVNGSISGTGGLTKNGTARLLMQGNHTYSGATTVASTGASSTALQLSGPGDLWLTNSDLTMNGRMDLVSHKAFVGALNGSGTIFANDLPNPTLVLGLNGHSGSFSGIIQDNTAGYGVSLSLLKAGPGVQTLSGANTFTGGTTIRAGQITLAIANALGTGPITFGDTLTATNAVLLLASTNGTYNNNLVVAAPALGPVSVGTANFNPGAVNTQFGGTLALNRDVTLVAGSAGGTTFGGQITGNGNLQIVSPYAVGRRLVISRPAGLPNTFTGNLTISNNAWLQIGASGGVSNRCIPDGAIVQFNAGAQLRFSPSGSGDSETLGALNSVNTGAGTVDVTSGTAFTLLTGGGDASGWFGGSILNSAGSLAVTKIGNGTQTLAGPGGFTGVTTISNGLVLAANATALGSAVAGTVVNSGATLAFSNSITITAEPLTLHGPGFHGLGALCNLAGTNACNGTLTLGSPATITAAAGTLALGGAWNTSGRTITFDTGADASIVAGSGISGSGAVVKTNAGTLVLNSANSFSGALTIAGGTLSLGPVGSVDQSPTVEVQAGAVLDATALTAGLTIPGSQALTGRGTVIGDVFINGTLTPGASLGGLTFSNNLTLAGSASFEVKKLGAVLTNDFAGVAGTLTLGGALIVTNTGDALTSGDTFTLFPGAAGVGAFSSTILPVLASGLRWDLSQLTVNGAIRVASITPPKITGTGLSAGVFEFQFLSETGVNYVLQSATDCAPPIAWSNVSTNAGTGAPLVLTAPVDQPQQFYRIIAH